MKETLTRASRNRRVVALMAWAGLAVTAFSLWNSRVSGFIRVVTAEPVAFILAAFAAFVSVFAWMLYNPTRKSAAESPELFLAMAATLFPPPVIGFCLMPIESPLRWWLALGIFMLCVIAVLSHVPDEFFDVPRGRHTYLTPLPAFDRVRDSAMDPDAAWFTFNDLSRIVVDTERPSLVPREYLQRQQVRQTGVSTATVRSPLMPYSDVDDILGPDFDIDFMSDADMTTLHAERKRSGDDLNRPRPPVNRDRQPSRPLLGRPVESASMEAGRLPDDGRNRGDFGSNRGIESGRAGNVYSAINPESLRIARSHRLHRNPSTIADRSFVRTSRQRLADSIRVEKNRSRHDAAAAGLPVDTVAKSRTSTFRPPLPAVTSVTPAVSPAVRSRSATELERERQEILENQRRDAERVRLEEQNIRAEREAASRREREKIDAERLRTEQIETARAERERAEREAAALDARTAEKADSSSSYRRKGRDITADSGVMESSSGKLATGAAAAPLIPEYRPEIPSQSRQLKAPLAEESAVEKPAARSGRREMPTLERIKDEHGGEMVEGVMKVRFDKGQKRANLHVPFSPPLGGMPEVECECVDGEDLRLKVPVRQSYGIRIEARRSNAEEPLEAEIGFAAVYTP